MHAVGPGIWRELKITAGDAQNSGNILLISKSGYNVLGCSRFFDAHGRGKESVSKSCFCVNLFWQYWIKKL